MLEKCSKYLYKFKDIAKIYLYVLRIATSYFRNFYSKTELKYFVLSSPILYKMLNFRNELKDVDFFIDDIRYNIL